MYTILLTEHMRGIRNYTTYTNNVTASLKYAFNSKILALYFLELNLYLVTQKSGFLVV